jgi:Neuraminidase-like domain/Putative peptidoglycan binding domain
MKKVLSVGDVGDDVAAAHRLLEEHGFSIPAAEVERQFFGPGTRAALGDFQRAKGIEESGEVGEKTATLLAGEPATGIRTSATESPALPFIPKEDRPPVHEPPASSPANNGAVTGPEVFIVAGKISSSFRAGIGGLRVRIVDKNACQDEDLTEAITDDSGTYQAAFKVASLRKRGKQHPDLQARVFARETFLAASEVRYNASDHETLNVRLTQEASSALPSEHETLTKALSVHYQGNLGDVQETDDCQGITYLANKTGWDARAVALAALADQFSQHGTEKAEGRGAAGIHPSFYYALFRAGLPASADTLYHADAATVVRIWKQAIDQGVIPAAIAPQIDGALKTFQNLGAQKLLTAPPLVGASSIKEMLKVSGITDLQQQQFADLYTINRADMPKFWEAVTAAFGADTATRLQVDGKLGFLTINNASLMQAMHQAIGGNGVIDPLQLAQAGYHRPDMWTNLLAGVPVPKEIPGDTPEAQIKNYAEYLAAKVRLSYPTASVAQMVKSGDLPLTGAPPGAADQVHAFLTANQEFEIGMQSVEQYIARKNLTVPADTVTQIKRIHRVYQITPSDQAMNGLMRMGIDAAHHVVGYDRETFVQSHQEALGGGESAAQTYDKSVQVHNAVLNIAVSYLLAGTAPGIGVHSAARIINPTPVAPDPEAANAADVIAYPTLEGLFNSMDFCACDHCRSILSPAAYLVDLLQFLDRDPEEWAQLLINWHAKRGGAPYPFADQDAANKFQKDWDAQHPGQTAPATEVTPLQVLLERRPDIQHLPLTCENTNTALPYIDIVNETLEYFIANNVQKLSLNGYVGNDTNDTASEDLLASPQFVLDSAYMTLQAERFPAPLPFHQPLESLRRYFNRFEVPLPLAMERLRQKDDLERSGNHYSWRDILMEESGISRAEYEILTDSNAVPLWRMYGFPSGTSDADVIAGNANVAGLSNTKQFTRRVGITYDDIVAILKTRFVNPSSELVPKLQRLGISFATLNALKEGTITDDAFGALLTKAGSLDPAEDGGDIKAWVRNDVNFARLMGLIVLTDPTNNPDQCNFDNFEFRYAKPAIDVGGTSTRLGMVEFIRLLRFIRLWKKTKWTIEQTDAAICALYRADMSAPDVGDIDSVAKLDAGFLVLLPRIGVVIRVMRALNLTAKRDLLPLLALWSDIGTHGDSALYRRMFLNPTVLEQDPVFADDGYGSFLQSRGVLYSHPQPFLEPAILNAAPGQIGYDDARKRLSFSGLLTSVMRDALKTAAGMNPAFQAVVDDLYAAQFLVTHAEALRGAFNLTGHEFSQIVKALNFSVEVGVPYDQPQATLDQAILDVAAELSYDNVGKRLSYAGALSSATRNALQAVAGVSETFKSAVDALFSANSGVMTPVTLGNISAIYRRAWLARALKISVQEFLLLSQLTGLDPFAAPDPTAPAILKIISLVQTLKDRSLKSAAALYLIWNQDLSGKSAPEPAQLTEFARTLRTDFAAIENQFMASDDPGGDIVRNRMTLVYGQEVAEAFFALLDDTLPLDVTYIHDRPALEDTITSTKLKISYDSFRHLLSYTGVLTIATRDALKAIPAVSNAFRDAVDSLFARGEDIKGSFFARHPEMKQLYEGYVASALPVDKKREVLLAEFRPELSRRRKRQQALQRLSAAANLDLTSTVALMDPAGAPLPSFQFPLHARGQSKQPLLEDVMALEMPGLAAQFFFSETATGAVGQSILAAANLDYSAGDNPLPANPAPGAAISGIWNGQIETTEAGFYNFVIEVDSAAAVSLKIGGQDCPLTQNGNIYRNTKPMVLTAGTLYEMVLQVEKVRNILKIKWETPKRAREVIPARYLYPPTIFAPFSDACTRLLKMASLAVGLGLTISEISHFATDPDYQIASDGWLNALPVAGDPAPATAAALLKPFQALLDFARIKAQLSPGDESLLTVLQDPEAATANSKSLLYTLTRWDKKSLSDLLAHFGGPVAGLARFDLLRHIYDAFALLQTLGISAAALIRATTNDPHGDTLRDFQAALRARYDAASWRDVIRPINDELRDLQRDALVAYILHQMRSNSATDHIDTADKLFEYFLTDVQMEPCMQTSRIRHALSSVQLFTERCLMNLEPRVSAATINAQQWNWRKRYRVWEANRKVFLFPENWLEPELRDDKSPFFKEIESELLQSDITEDSATTAFLNYLSKLEEVAKLEPCGIFHETGNPGLQTPDVDHVIARTAGANRKYYYRRKKAGSWTPWEQIKLDIEDNPVIPVVWNGRLLLFWLRILKKGPDTVQPPLTKDVNLTEISLADINTSPPLVTVAAVLCWSEYYNSKWQPTKTSDVNQPIDFDGFYGAYYDRSNVHLSVDEDKVRDTLRVTVLGGTIVSFLLYNTHSLPVPTEKPPLHQEGNKRYVYNTYPTPESLTILYVESRENQEGQNEDTSFWRPVLNNSPHQQVVLPRQTLANAWDAPFFLEDSRHVFYVTTEEADAMIFDFPSYGAAVGHFFQKGAELPSLVLQSGPRLQIGPKLWGDGGPVAPDLGIIDPSPIQRYVTEDAYIRQGLGTAGSVAYGGKQIGPAGVIAINQVGIKR